MDRARARAKEWTGRAHTRRRLLAFGSAVPFTGTYTPVTDRSAAYRVSSPNGRVEVIIATDAAGRPSYHVLFDRRIVLAPSGLGLDLGQDGMLAQGLAVVHASQSSINRHYTLVTGKTRDAWDHCNQLQLDLRQRGSHRELCLTFRAYDDGIAFRYRILSRGIVSIKTELTEFNFPTDYICWGFNMGRFGTDHDDAFRPMRASLIRPRDLFDIPLVYVTGSAVIAIAQANLANYAGMGLIGRSDCRPGVQVKLAPRPDDPEIAVRGRPRAELLSPWRVLMIGDYPGRLIESTLITSLNPPSQIADSSWIRPGKYAWDWWSGDVVSGVAVHDMNNATIQRFIDFAAGIGLPYMLIDAGWYVTVGGDMGGPGADVTRSIPEIHLPELIEYARQRNIGVWVWVDWKPLNAQMDKALSLYQRLGLKGIKIDFLHSDDQDMVDWYHALLAKAAQHRLLVDLHGCYPPDGIRRTYPNLLTQKDVMGAEFNKWSARITATHNVTLPFTRMLLGPMDYTPGGFRNVTQHDFVARYKLPLVQTTRGQALAMYFVYESPFQAIADTPDAYEGQAGVDFLAVVPTTWDETRVIAGEIAEFIVIARRNRNDWFVGAMTNEQERTVIIPLAFLRDDRFKARIYADGGSPTALTISERVVTRNNTIELRLASSGGGAIWLQPQLA
jgi:alpha-glucosidase